MMLGFFSGCSSKSNFYQLHPTPTKQPVTHQSKKAVVIGIAEVEVAEYLKKSEVVTRLGAGRIHVHETDLWAGSLADNIQSVLMHNIAVRLPRYTFLASPWEEPLEDKYRIYITIERFDTDENGRATLQGRWSLVDKSENSVHYSESVNYIEDGGTTLNEIIDTQSRLLDKLSRRIAGKIQKYL
jgi:uncharacterized lipoprotein YmbA